MSVIRHLNPFWDKYAYFIPTRMYKSSLELYLVSVCTTCAIIPHTVDNRRHKYGNELVKRDREPVTVDKGEINIHVKLCYAMMDTAARRPKTWGIASAKDTVCISPGISVVFIEHRKGHIKIWMPAMYETSHKC